MSATPPPAKHLLLRLLPPIALVAMILTLLLGTAPGRLIWCTTLYPALVWLNVDHWFPATAEIPLLDLSGPDVAQPGTSARTLEVAKVDFIAARYTDIDYPCRVLDPGSGPTVRVRVRTWHPMDSRSLADTIRRTYLTHATDPEVRLATEFVADWPWPEHAIDGKPIPLSIDFPPPVPGVPWEPTFDATAQLVLRAGTNAVPRLLSIATRTAPASYNALEAHILLCKILGVRPGGASDEWCGIRAPDWTAHRREHPDVRSIWTTYLETGALPEVFQ